MKIRFNRWPGYVFCGRECWCSHAKKTVVGKIGTGKALMKGAALGVQPRMALLHQTQIVIARSVFCDEAIQVLTLNRPNRVPVEKTTSKPGLLRRKKRSSQ